MPRQSALGGTLVAKEIWARAGRTVSRQLRVGPWLESERTSCRSGSTLAAVGSPRPRGQSKFADRSESPRPPRNFQHQPLISRVVVHKQVNAACSLRCRSACLPNQEPPRIAEPGAVPQFSGAVIVESRRPGPADRSRLSRPGSPSFRFSSSFSSRSGTNDSGRRTSFECAVIGSMNLAIPLASRIRS